VRTGRSRKVFFLDNKGWGGGAREGSEEKLNRIHPGKSGFETSKAVAAHLMIGLQAGRALWRGKARS